MRSTAGVALALDAKLEHHRSRLELIVDSGRVSIQPNQEKSGGALRGALSRASSWWARLSKAANRSSSRRRGRRSTVVLHHQFAWSAPVNSV